MFLHRFLIIKLCVRGHEFRSSGHTNCFVHFWLYYSSKKNCNPTFFEYKGIQRPFAAEGVHNLDISKKKTPRAKRLRLNVSYQKIPRTPRIISYDISLYLSSNRSFIKWYKNKLWTVSITYFVEIVSKHLLWLSRPYKIQVLKTICTQTDRQTYILYPQDIYEH